MADTLSCQWETLHSQQLRSIKKSIDSDHGIYRYRGASSYRCSAVQPHGRSRCARSSRRCRPSARWLLAISARKNSGGSFGRDYAIWGISRGRTFDLSFARRKDRSTGFPNWQLSWFVSRSMSSSLGSRPPLWRQSKRASSDPTAMKLANKAKKAPCGGVCGGGRSGVGGAKGGGQGEYGPAKHVLDSEPGSRVKGAGAHTATCAVTHPRQEPYAGKPHVRIWAGGVR